MKKADMTYVLGMVYVTLTSLFYCSVSFFHITVPRYYPLEHTWKMVNEKGIPSQGWYGLQGFAYVAAGIGTLIIYLIIKALVRGEGEVKSGLIRGLGIAALLAFLFAMGYTLHHEYAKWGILATQG